MIKNIIKSLLSFFGLQISKLHPQNSLPYQIAQSLKAHQINVVFDIGANEGQFAAELLAQGYTGKIISVEPLPNAYKALCNKAKKYENWHVHARSAIGNTKGKININVAGNSVSSSILPMLPSHAKAAPKSQYTHIEEVEITSLDDIFNNYVSSKDKVFIKIDTQGYESAVLDGAKDSLTMTSGLLLEMSLVPLYQGQILWEALMDRLHLLGYKIFSIHPGFSDTSSGKTLQFDGVFFREINPL